MKKTLKFIWAWVWYTSRLIDFYVWLRSKLYGQNQTAILLYHRVAPREKAGMILSLPEIVVYQDSFEQQIRFLSENYHIISLNDFLNAMVERTGLPRKTVVITFDDGWEDNYLYAFPILWKYKVPATIFLTTGLIGTRDVFWQEKIIFLIKKLLPAPDALRSCFYDNRLDELQPLVNNLVKDENDAKAWTRIVDRLKYVDTTKRDNIIRDMEKHANLPELPVDENSFLNWGQVREMAKSQIHFASHGVTHRTLTLLTENELKEELVASRKFLEEKLGEPVHAFAYAGGDYNDKVVGLLEDIGYRLAVTVEPGLNARSAGLYRLKRINVCEGRFVGRKGDFSQAMFSAYLAGIL